MDSFIRNILKEYILKELIHKICIRTMISEPSNPALIACLAAFRKSVMDSGSLLQSRGEAGGSRR